MKIVYKRIISFVVLIAILGLFAYYIYRHLGEFKELSIVNPWYIVLLIGIFLLNYIFIGIITAALLKPFNVNLGKGEAFGLSVATGFYNLITPFRGGMLARAVYLKNKYNFSYTKFISTLSGSYVITFLTASVLGLISLWLIYQEQGLFNWVILLVFLVFFIPLMIIVLFSPKLKERKGFVNKFVSVINGWYEISRQRKVVLIIFVMTILQFIFSGISSIISYHIFGVQITLSQALFLVALGNLGIVVQITPAGLGVSEAISVFSAYAIGIQPEQSIPVALLGRVVSMIVLFILGPIYSYTLLKKNRSKD